MNDNEWINEWPQEEGYYWFVGKWHGRVRRPIFVDRHPNMTVAEGVFLYQGEVEGKFWFKKAELPSLPFDKSEIKGSVE